MGHTHYNRNMRFTKGGWDLFCNDVEKLFKSLPSHVKIDNESGGPPHIGRTDGYLRFNGIGDEGCETFIMAKKGDDFEFCKTNHMPYDFAVFAVLILASYHAKSGNISSDGFGDTYIDRECQEVWTFVSNLIPELKEDPKQTFKLFSAGWEQTIS